MEVSGATMYHSAFTRRSNRGVQTILLSLHTKNRTREGGYLLDSGGHYRLWSGMPVIRRWRAFRMRVAACPRPGGDAQRPDTDDNRLRPWAAPQTLSVRPDGLVSHAATRIGPFATTRSCGHLSQVNNQLHQFQRRSPALGVRDRA